MLELFWRSNGEMTSLSLESHSVSLSDFFFLLNLWPFLLIRPLNNKDGKQAPLLSILISQLLVTKPSLKET